VVVMTKTSLDSQSVVQREKEFHEEESRSFARVRRWIARAIGAFDRSNEIFSFAEVKDALVLDYGCGAGRVSKRLVTLGAKRVVGFDLSESRAGRARAAVGELDGQTEASFAVADGHKLPFDDGAFDVVIGTAVLHHLDLDVALPEIERVLKPGGRAIFQEPMKHNPLLRLGRFLTPAARTPDEHPFSVDDWAACERHFAAFRHQEHEFITIPFMPLNWLLPRSAQKKLGNGLSRVDQAIFKRVPALRRYARITILVLDRAALPDDAPRIVRSEAPPTTIDLRDSVSEGAATNGSHRP
jgi:SAM-dependent methyltransferase